MKTDLSHDRSTDAKQVTQLVSDWTELFHLIIPVQITITEINHHDVEDLRSIFPVLDYRALYNDHKHNTAHTETHFHT